MTTTTLLKLTVVGIALLLLGSSCEDNNPPKPKDPVTIVYTMGEVKDYMLFKKGTYWVYENDKTGTIDSQWVTGSSFGQITHKGNEDYSMHLTLIQDFFVVTISTNFVDGLGYKCRYEMSSNGNKVDAFPYPKRAYGVNRSRIADFFGGTSEVYYHPYDACPKKNCDWYYDTVLTNYQLKGYSYDTVRVFKVTNDRSFPEIEPLSGRGDSWYYFAKNHGLIKLYNEGFLLKDGSVFKESWNLIRKKIVQ
jgi:hypothetical protein